MPKLALKKPRDPLRTHLCGACGTRLFTARYVDSGMLVHVERDRNRAGDLVVLAELPNIMVAGRCLPHVERTTSRLTDLREHDCPKVKARR